MSVGVTVDSYIVYFERLKDDIRGGKTVRTSVDRGFSRAYRTILAADLVSFLAAVILYLFTVGSVRGFAFTLGLSTLLDVITAYFFTRPMVILLGRNRLFTEARYLRCGPRSGRRLSGRCGVSDTKHSIWTRLYRGETSFDFVGHRRRWYIMSGTVILVGLIFLVVNGLNFSIDFKGGTVWEVPSTASVGQVHDVIGKVSDEFRQANVQILTDAQTGKKTVRVSAQANTTKDKTKVTAVSEALADMAHVSVNQVTLNDVGASWGHDITNKAIRALIIFLIAVSIYITFRFEGKMAIAAFIALIHDILVTVGIYALSGLQVSPATIIAFLTILGYSLYDTIVVFDKVEENAKGIGASGRMTYSDIVNLSMNQVLMRSINTSLVAIMPILSILVIGSLALGASALQDFGLALFIGLLTGAYSSIFIASPVLADAQGARAPLHPDPRAPGDPCRRGPAHSRPPRLPRSEPAWPGDRPVPGATSRPARRAAPTTPPPRPFHRAGPLTRPARGWTRCPSSRRPFRGRRARLGPAPAGRPANRPPPRPRKKGRRR